LSAIKEVLLAHCIESVQQRIRATREAIRLLQISANEETKSSAGDKYETGRAMAQLEIEKLGAQLADATAQLTVLKTISPNQASSIVQLGSLVETNYGNFYLAGSIGEVKLEGAKYLVISAKSPIGQKLTGLTVGQAFILNGRNFELLKLL
jgi:transcription elongation GreA/GreB family factor